jgi:superfamily II DNA helicase RecQ
MLPTTRELNHHRLLREDGLVMVATTAFGMGIDKPTSVLLPTLFIRKL